MVSSVIKVCGTESCHFLTDTENFWWNSNREWHISNGGDYGSSVFWFCPNFLQIGDFGPKFYIFGLNFPTTQDAMMLLTLTVYSKGIQLHLQLLLIWKKWVQPSPVLQHWISTLSQSRHRGYSMMTLTSILTHTSATTITAGLTTRRRWETGPRQPGSSAGVWRVHAVFRRCCC